MKRRSKAASRITAIIAVGLAVILALGICAACLQNVFADPDAAQDTTEQVTTGEGAGEGAEPSEGEGTDVPEVPVTDPEDGGEDSGEGEDTGSEIIVDSEDNPVDIELAPVVDAEDCPSEVVEEDPVIEDEIVTEDVTEAEQTPAAEETPAPQTDVSSFTAARYSVSPYTGSIEDLSKFANASAKRKSIVNYAMQFLGNPYVWGGESLTNGCDCSGYVRGIYAHFGIYLPRTSAEQAEAGKKIRMEQCLPGDLIFYSNASGVYHVLMYVGGGKAINAKSTNDGIVISDIAFEKVCWACRFLEDEYSSTQAADLVEQGMLARDGDEAAQRDIIGTLAIVSEKAWNKYGLAKSVIIAHIIEETNWCTFDTSEEEGIQPEDNNLFAMTADFHNDEWESEWEGEPVERMFPDSTEDGVMILYPKDMRSYEDMEAAVCDYAAYITKKNPELVNEKDTDKVIADGLSDFGLSEDLQGVMKEIIENYKLKDYDSVLLMGVDGRKYTQKELELIWALVAQEDDTSYEGALGVISSVMNRADINFDGFGTSALEQLTAPGQYCYSANVSPAWMYQRRLNGNVDEFVKQAVSDCLTKGIRNNSFLDFRSTNATGNRVQIGCNWYF